MIKIKEDHTVVRDGLAVFTYFFLPMIFFAALPAPVVDDPVVSPAHILLEAAPVHAVHFAVRIARLVKQPVDHFHDAIVAGRITVLHLLKFLAEKLCRLKKIGMLLHGSAGPRVKKFDVSLPLFDQ